MPSLAPSPARDFFMMPFRKRKYTINPPDEVHNVVYLGNVLTIMGKGEQSVEKPLALIWKAYLAKQQRHELSMKLMVTRSGLKAETKLQGLTEYWAHRVTYCCAPSDYPKVFCWIYKHDGKKMKPELRCHAVLCKKTCEPGQISTNLQHYLASALQEYKREKRCIEKARKVSAQAGGHGLGPRRKLLLQSGSLNFRPPVSRSKSAPRLGSIDEEDEVDEQQPFQQSSNFGMGPIHIHEPEDDAFEEDELEEEEEENCAGPLRPRSDETEAVEQPVRPRNHEHPELDSLDEDEEEDEEEEQCLFKRQLSMSTASKRRHQSLPHTPGNSGRFAEALASHLVTACRVRAVSDEEEEEDEVPSGSDVVQAPSSSCASSDDGFASSCQSSDLEMHRNQRASLRRRIRAITEPDSISDESGYHEQSTDSQVTTSRQSSHSNEYSDDDEDMDDFEEQRKVALTAQMLLTAPATIDLEANVQVTAL